MLETPAPAPTPNPEVAAPALNPADQAEAATLLAQAGVATPEQIAVNAAGEAAKIEAAKEDEGGAVALQAGAPSASYELKMPTGMELNPEVYSKMEPLLKEANVGSGQAQILAEKVYPALLEQVRGEMKTQGEAAFNTAVADWTKAVKADPVLSAPGAMAAVALARDTFLSADTRKFLEETKLGSHPALLRDLKAIGEKLQTSSVAQPTAQATTRSPVERRYGPAFAN